MSTIYYIPLLILLLILGAYILLRAPNAKINRVFAYLTLSLAFWVLTLYISDSSKDYQTVLLWTQLAIIGPVLAVYFLTVFSFIFPYPNKGLKNKALFIFFIPTFLLLIPTFSKYNVIDVTIHDWGTEPTVGTLYTLMIPYIIVYIFIFFRNLFIKYKASKDEYGGQIKYVSLGIILMLAFGATTNLFLIISGHAQYSILGPASTLLFLSLTAYAVAKHHLFNIKVIATETLVVILWIILFIKIFSALSFKDSIDDILIFAITIPFGILLIRSVIKEVRLAEQQYEMVATVSHQLRTPLTPVLGYAAMMDQGDFDGHPEELKDAQHRLLISTQRLRNIINDFLQMFELEGEHKMDSVKTPLQDIVNEAMAGVKENYEQKKLYLKLENPSNVNPILVGETKLLVQAINNLLDNAQRYTIEGGSTVQLSVEKNRAIIKVTDTGIGLDENDKQRLFTKFYRSDAAKEVRPDGSGLGLPIVKTVVEAHGGKVHAESEGRGKGTTFIIELPLKKQ